MAKTPHRRHDATLPLGVAIAGLIATAIYVLGSISLLAAVPAASLVERSGITDAVNLVSARIGLGGFGPVTGLLLAIGSLAMTNSWFAGAARVPFMAGVDRVLPPVFARMHPRYRTPHVVLVMQGIVSSAICLISVFFTFGGRRTSIQEAYDIMVNLTILIYFVPYVYLFLCLVKLRPEKGSATLRVFGAGLWLAAAAGGFATVVSLALVFVAPPGTDNIINYEINLIGQAGAIMAVGFALYFSVRRKGRSSGEDSPGEG